MVDGEIVVKGRNLDLMYADPEVRERLIERYPHLPLALSYLSGRAMQQGPGSDPQGTRPSPEQSVGDAMSLAHDMMDAYPFLARRLIAKHRALPYVQRYVEKQRHREETRRQLARAEIAFKLARIRWYLALARWEQARARDHT